MYFNCRSLLPKIDELAALCVETWLSVDVSDSEVAIHNYSPVRLDRNRHGSGVAVYVCNCVFDDVLSLALLSWSLLLYLCTNLVLNYVEIFL